MMNDIAEVWKTKLKYLETRSKYLKKKLRTTTADLDMQKKEQAMINESDTEIRRIRAILKIMRR